MTGKIQCIGCNSIWSNDCGFIYYIGPQGIVHGTTITVMNAFRKVLEKGESPKGKIFLTAGLGGMSGARQAGNIT